MEAVAAYELIEAIPAVEDYLRLREISGLTPRSIEAARAGLPGSFFAVCIGRGSETVAMGRIISDGALFFHLVDVRSIQRTKERGWVRLSSQHFWNTFERSHLLKPMYL